jgi:DNA-binding protein Fis
LQSEFVATPKPLTNPSSRLQPYLTDLIKTKEGEIYRHVIDAVEEDVINWALSEKGNNQVQAARLLGISRVMIHERIEKFRHK